VAGGVSEEERMTLCVGRHTHCHSTATSTPQVPFDTNIVLVLHCLTASMVTRRPADATCDVTIQNLPIPCVSIIHSQAHGVQLSFIQNRFPHVDPLPPPTTRFLSNTALPFSRVGASALLTPVGCKPWTCKATALHASYTRHNRNQLSYITHTSVIPDLLPTKTIRHKGERNLHTPHFVFVALNADGNGATYKQLGNQLIVKTS